LRRTLVARRIMVCVEAGLWLGGVIIKPPGPLTTYQWEVELDDSSRAVAPSSKQTGSFFVDLNEVSVGLGYEMTRLSLLWPSGVTLQVKRKTHIPPLAK
jgi:hypothetical protein